MTGIGEKRSCGDKKRENRARSREKERKCHVLLSLQKIVLDFLLQFIYSWFSMLLTDAFQPPQPQQFQQIMFNY